MGDNDFLEEDANIFSDDENMTDNNLASKGKEVENGTSLNAEREKPQEEKEIKYKNEIMKLVISLLEKNQNPSAFELLKKIEDLFGFKSWWFLVSALKELSNSNKPPFKLTGAGRDYCFSLIQEYSNKNIFEEDGEDRKEIISTIDTLLAQSAMYGETKAFSEMVAFMANFRDYAPYNNMLVKLQNPSCGYYATEKDWKERFNRDLIEDARPMIILAPMHPVMLVFDLDQTTGPSLPEHLTKFAKFTGEWDRKLYEKLIENANRHLIRVNFKPLSQTNGGFVTYGRKMSEWKMRIAIHDKLDEPSRFGVLCHELAHVFLGHLGTDIDHWWPSRSSLDHSTIEIEAEAVAYIITNRLG